MRGLTWFAEGYIDGLVQDCISSALTIEMLKSCPKPPIYSGVRRYSAVFFSEILTKDIP